MRHWIVAAALLAWMAGVDASTHCEAYLDEEASAAERLYEMQSQPACADQIGPLMEEVAASVAQPLDTAGKSVEEVDDAAHERHALQAMVVTWRLRETLRNADIAAARRHVDELSQLIQAADEDVIDDAQLQLVAILDVLDGRTPPPDSTKALAARPDWVLTFGYCGTPLVMYLYGASTMPGAADAWLALGRPDYAVSSLLQSEWETAVALGTTPPRLREFAEAMLGPGSWKREVRVALQGIRMVKGIDGLQATLPLFGHALPLPIGYHSGSSDDAVMFTHPAEAAELMRSALLGPDATE